MAKVNVQYRIQLVESERGWGQDYWYEYYDTRKQAEERIKQVNAKNTALTAPDWYISAYEDIVVVEKGKR